ncbi:MAG: ion transporter [Bacteroidetes bacterium]|nr:ion transporter [Bacteroidota bacterium]
MKKFQKLKIFVEQNDTKGGKYFDIFIQLLILLSILSFTVESIPNLSQELRNVLDYLEIISVTIFTIEYLLRLFVADSRIRFIFSFYGMIDLLAILPFYVASGIDLRSIRIFRLFRLIRLFKLFRYSKAIKRYKNAFSLIKAELAIFLSATLFLLYVSSVGIYYFENSVQPEQFSSVFHCMWWAVATLTTIGYGDMYPITAGGKIFTSIIVIIGLGVVAVPTGLFASALTKCIQLEDKEK